MNDQLQDARTLVIWIVPIALPVFFVLLWLFITTILALASGWFRLAKAFPDQPEQAIREFRGLSGVMGAGVNIQNVLRLSVCRAGLRIGIVRALGPFSKDFLVPWTQISVRREKARFREKALSGMAARLSFGTIGSLAIAAVDADRLAEVAARLWPENQVERQAIPAQKPGPVEQIRPVGKPSPEPKPAVVRSRKWF